MNKTILLIKILLLTLISSCYSEIDLKIKEKENVSRSEITVFSKDTTPFDTNSMPSAIAADKLGNIFITDTNYGVIRKINSSGESSIFAGQIGIYGTDDGLGTLARFMYPVSIATDSSNNIYVGDGNSVRKITPAGMVTTLPGYFVSPNGIAVDSAGNVFVADTYSYSIKKITPSGDVTSLFNQASFYGPFGIAIDSLDNIYATGAGGGGSLVKITPSQDITIIAGENSYNLNYILQDGPAEISSFGTGPRALAVDSSDNVYVLDKNHTRIRKVAPNGNVTTLSGTYSALTGIAIDKEDRLYVTQSEFANALSFD